MSEFAVRHCFRRCSKIIITGGPPVIRWIHSVVVLLHHRGFVYEKNERAGERHDPSSASLSTTVARGAFSFRWWRIDRPSSIVILVRFVYFLAAAPNTSVSSRTMISLPSGRPSSASQNEFHDLSEHPSRGEVPHTFVSITSMSSPSRPKASNTMSCSMDEWFEAVSS